MVSDRYDRGFEKLKEIDDDVSVKTGKGFPLVDLEPDKNRDINVLRVHNR
jgi:hypothetical protein